MTDRQFRVPAKEANPERQAAFRTGISAESRAAALLVAKGFRISRSLEKPDRGNRYCGTAAGPEAKARSNLDEDEYDQPQPPPVAINAKIA